MRLLVLLPLMLSGVVMSQNHGHDGGHFSKHRHGDLLRMLKDLMKDQNFHDMSTKDQTILIELLAEGEAGTLEEYITRVGIDVIMNTIKNLSQEELTFFDGYLRAHHAQHFVDTNSTTVTMPTSTTTTTSPSTTVTYPSNLVVVRMESRMNGATFIHWGKKSCPDGTERVYRGFAAGTTYNNRAGPGNTLCLSEDPIYDEHDTTNLKGGASLFGAEYQDFRKVPDYSRVRYHDIPCAVCQLQEERNVLMIPGRNACYRGWHKKYSGYLIAGHFGYSASEYLCMNKNPDSIHGSGDQAIKTQRFYLVEGYCTGSLLCPPYKPYAEITCAVCAN